MFEALMTVILSLVGIFGDDPIYLVAAGLFAVANSTDQIKEKLEDIKNGI